MNEIEKKKVKVSIIIPVHNSEKTLVRCMESILAQDYMDIECILVENGSSDNSKSICIDYANKYKRVLHKSIIETGVSEARNVGLSMATGEIIGFCDADDFLESNVISEVVKQFLKDCKISILIGGFNLGVESIDKKILKTPRGIRKRILSPNKALHLVLTNDAVMGSVWNKYYSAKCLNEIKFCKDLAYCEDMHFNALVLNSMKSTNTIKVIDLPLYCYMENEESVTHNVDTLFNCNDELQYITAMNRIEHDCELDNKSKNLIKMKIACFAVDALTDKVLEERQKQMLVKEVNKNYLFLIRYIFLNNWKWNIKRVIKCFKIIVDEKGVTK